MTSGDVLALVSALVALTTAVSALVTVLRHLLTDTGIHSSLHSRLSSIETAQAAPEGQSGKESPPSPNQP